LPKTGWAIFWAICFTNSSGRHGGKVCFCLKSNASDSSNFADDDFYDEFKKLKIKTALSRRL
jgi:hypothetical protein